MAKKYEYLVATRKDPKRVPLNYVGEYVGAGSIIRSRPVKAGDSINFDGSRWVVERVSDYTIVGDDGVERHNLFLKRKQGRRRRRYQAGDCRRYK